MVEFNFDASKWLTTQFTVKNLPTGTITAISNLKISAVINPKAPILAVSRSITRAVTKIFGWEITPTNNLAVLAVKANKLG